jgi:superfamily I DNA/RNA helicase
MPTTHTRTINAMTNTWWLKQGQLDTHQKNVFTLSITDDHLVKGPPGSGKTNLLLLRGKQLIGSNIPDVVVVVHTRTLQEFIRSGAPTYGIPATKIVTFRKLATDLLYRVGVSVTLPTDFDKSRSILVDACKHRSIRIASIRSMRASSSMRRKIFSPKK